MSNPRGACDPRNERREEKIFIYTNLRLIEGNFMQIYGKRISW